MPAVGPHAEGSEVSGVSYSMPNRENCLLLPDISIPVQLS